MRFVIAIPVVIVLAGCQTAAPRWDKPGATAADFERDKLACEYDATKATASGGNFGMSTAVGAGLAEGFKKVELMTLCMKTKGWTQSS